MKSDSIPNPRRSSQAASQSSRVADQSALGRSLSPVSALVSSGAGPAVPFPEEKSHGVAAIVSFLAHFACLLALALWFSDSGKGTGSEPEIRSVGLAVVHRTPDRTRYVTEPAEMPQSAEAAERSPVTQVSAASPRQSATADSSSNENTSKTPARNADAVTDPASNASAAMQAVPVPPIDLDGALAALRESGIGKSGADGESGDSGSTGPSGLPNSLVDGRVRFADRRSAESLEIAELVPGRSRPGLGAGRTTTQVFGVSGTGSTFVYVFDRSESMSAAGGAPLRALKSELIRSLKTLGERQQFQIIFYNDRADVFKAYGDRIGLVTGEDAILARASQFVRGMSAIGGTKHEPALRMALRLAPDVIFFLTDAKIQTMSDAQLDEISRRAESAGTTIHGIQFGTGPQPPGSFVKRLAERNHGGYRYFDVTDL
ncbi:von Willebrand factor type A domain-containing protein [Neorhodopirellula lusitana]|uniref:von Willebrand factor type A domain-containing protein n=1 Tax=Neorhodopirellula lusitana TaxID=445327 RepID=A0ABY1PT20_9BACT|nr:hypothetical protein [Neorhodopirellula lusitana]SMP44046.1 von Willebrand factor type A domain-containing protein [Neorhodopirellula lusitana]